MYISCSHASCLLQLVTQILSHYMTEHTPGTHFTLNVPAGQTSHTHSHIYVSTQRTCTHTCTHTNTQLKCVSSRPTQRLVSVTVGPSDNNITEHTPRPGPGAIPICSKQHTMTRHRKNSSSPQLKLVAKKLSQQALISPHTPSCCDGSPSHS